MNFLLKNKEMTDSSTKKSPREERGSGTIAGEARKLATLQAMQSGRSTDRRRLNVREEGGKPCLLSA